MALLRRARGLLTERQAIERARHLMSVRDGERSKLDDVRRYWKGVQSLPAVIPASAPFQVKVMAQIARVNVSRIVVDSLAQSTFVDNFRSTDDAEDAEVWDVWQANKLDARQTGIHRATFAYGVAYAVVMPGDPVPVIRGASPRNLTAVYGDDPDWPAMALEWRNGLWRLYDDRAVYRLSQEDGDKPGDPPRLALVATDLHGAGVVPIVRYLDEDDLDREDDVDPWPATIATDAQSATVTRAPLLQGQIAPLMPIQDQVDLTTFSLLVSQWYTAFRQRYAIGWVPKDEADKMKAAASQLWTFDKDPDKLKLGEFDQTDLGGYIESRKESLKHAATLSQTPVHELVGELANLSADALAAAEAGHDRKVDERKTLLGEAHEQTLRLAGDIGGIAVPDDAQVVWRDTSARAFSATVDALGKLATMLGVPEPELWERIPGVTKQDVERWKKASEEAPTAPPTPEVPEATPAA